jgi:hypothetical protein
MLRVEALKTGDRFAFLSSHSDDTVAPTMIVTRLPAVNPAANSCHFRYQPQPGAGAAIKTNEWQDNQSWNGAPGVMVRLIDRSSIEPPHVDSPPAAKRPRRKK